MKNRGVGLFYANVVIAGVSTDCGFDADFVLYILNRIKQSLSVHFSLFDFYALGGECHGKGHTDISETDERDLRLAGFDFFI